MDVLVILRLKNISTGNLKIPSLVKLRRSALIPVATVAKVTVITLKKATIPPPTTWNFCLLQIANAYNKRFAWEIFQNECQKQKATLLMNEIFY